MTTQSDSPFAPPAAHLADAPDVSRGSPLKAVLVGLAVDVGGSVVTSLLMGIGYGIFLSATGTSPGKISTLARMNDATSSLSITGYFVGFVFSVLGGYVCARIARHAEYRLGAILGVSSSLLGLLMGGSRHSLPITALLVLATIASTLVGAAIGYRRNRKP